MAATQEKLYNEQLLREQVRQLQEQQAKNKA